MDAPLLTGDGLGLIIDGAGKQIEDAAERLVADGDLDGRAGVHGLHAAHHAVRRAHGDAADHIVAELLGDLADKLAAVALDLDGVEQVGR